MIGFIFHLNLNSSVNANAKHFYGLTLLCYFDG